MKPPTFRFHEGLLDTEDLRATVIEGLSARPRCLPPKLFYDRRGSELFEVICALPEYYLTRTETAILHDCAEEVAAIVGQQGLLVELGSGASRKVRLLLETLQPASYLGIDISRDFLRESAQQLARDYPGLEVHAAWADFSRPFTLPAEITGGLPMAFFPGSSIGNCEPIQARALLSRIARLIGHGGHLLIGVDLQKDRDVMEAAYNDAQGVTAAFNRNVLIHIREALDAELNEEAFYHQAYYDETHGRIEMHLISETRQTIRIGSRVFHFAEGEGIHTENSHKYTVDGFHRLAGESGFAPERVWTDPDRLFSVHLLRAR
ncbi:MAG: L-histidine N(alpha)-methyltransferase [Pseudomonadota bacterium]